MTKTKTILAVLILLIIGGLYWYVYGDAFQKPAIEIGLSFREARAAAMRRGPPAARPGRPAVPLGFALGHEYRLTAVKVVELAAFKSNRFALPVWELVSASNSVPLRYFDYGQNIRGMHPAMTNARPEPLASNLTYRIFIEAGKKLKGQRDFTLDEDAQPPK
jgi:hypothetical protein